MLKLQISDIASSMPALIKLVYKKKLKLEFFIEKWIDRFGSVKTTL